MKPNTSVKHKVYGTGKTTAYDAVLGCHSSDGDLTLVTFNTPPPDLKDPDWVRTDDLEQIVTVS